MKLNFSLVFQYFSGEYCLSDKESCLKYIHMSWQRITFQLLHTVFFYSWYKRCVYLAGLGILQRLSMWEILLKNIKDSLHLVNKLSNTAYYQKRRACYCVVTATKLISKNV